MDERESVPLRGLRPHRRGHPGCGSGTDSASGLSDAPLHPRTSTRLAAALAFRAQAGRNDAPAEYIAGGTDMVQLLQEYVRRPDRLVSLAGLLDDRIEARPAGPEDWRRRHDGGCGGRTRP